MAGVCYVFGQAKSKYETTRMAKRQSRKMLHKFTREQKSPAIGRGLGEGFSKGALVLWTKNNKAIGLSRL